MAHQHHDFKLRLRDAERLWLFVQSRISDQEALDGSLKENQLSSRREAKKAVERVVWAEAKRDTARHEAAMARLEIEAMSGAWTQVEAELARVRGVSATAKDARLKADSERDAARQALVVAEEARRKAEEENGCLTDERLSLLMELGATKDDFAAFRERTSTEKTTMEGEFDASSDMIFNYGYGCCTFAHNICRSEPLIPARMLDTSTPLTPEFFMNPRCPPNSSFVFPDAEPVKTIGEDLLAKCLPVAGDEVDIPQGHPARSDKELDVAVKG